MGSTSSRAVRLIIKKLGYIDLALGDIMGVQTTFQTNLNLYPSLNTICDYILHANCMKGHVLFSIIVQHCSSVIELNSDEVVQRTGHV